MRWAALVLAPIVLVPLLAAGKAPDVDRLLREAYAAFLQNDLDRAAVLYERAEERSTDPARVAFDLAAVQYRQALAANDPRLLAEAEQNYRCCLDQPGPNRGAALYGLGNCRLARAGERDGTALRDALDAYEECLREPDLSEDLAAAARFNREKARLALLQVQAAAPSSAESEPTGSDAENRPPPERTPEDSTAEPGERTGGSASAGAEARRLKGDDRGNAHETNETRPPGRGNLPPVPDDQQAAPLPPRDAAVHLEQAASRIHAERQRTLRSRAGKTPLPGVRDW